MPPVKPIILNARTPQGECIGAVRLTPGGGAGGPPVEL